MRHPIRLAAFAALLLVLATAGTALADDGSRDGDHGQHYYVSVGDSLAAGVQPIGDPANLFRTDSGYAEQLLAIARTHDRKLKLIKLGCPGETTTTMIAGGICAYRHGSQLDQAVHFLRAHRSKVSFITIDIGANDFPCQQPQCIPAGVASLQTNLPTILAALRKAAGPTVRSWA